MSATESRAKRIEVYQDDVNDRLRWLIKAGPGVEPGPKLMAAMHRLDNATGRVVCVDVVCGRCERCGPTEGEET